MLRELSNLPPSALKQISEQVRDVAHAVDSIMHKQIRENNRKLDIEGRFQAFANCCKIINKELDAGTDIEKAINLAHKQAGGTLYRDDVAHWWLEIGCKVRPKRKKLARDRRIMVLYRLGYTDAQIAKKMQSENPSWKSLHPKTVGKAKLAILGTLDRGRWDHVI